MMKRRYSIIAATLLTAGVMLTTTACSNDDVVIDNPAPVAASGQDIQFTATLAPKGDDGAQTRAITTGTDGEGKEILNVTWKKNEQIAIYYQKTDDTYATATATVDEVDGETGAATITASLPDAKDNGEAKFVYPASLANDTGDIDNTKLLNNQKGTLADISENFDAATATGTIAVSGSTASVSGSVAMTNRFCICKFSFTYKYAIGTTVELNKLNSLTIKTVSGDYTIGPVSPATTGDVYVAMLPGSNMNFAFIANASFTEGYMGSTSDFMAFPTNVSLTAGKFYRNLPVTLTLTTLKTGAALRDLSENAITASDGDIIWQSNNEATANTITIPDEATVTLAGVNISAAGSAGIICSGNATIKLNSTNTVTATTNNFPALQPGGSGKTLTINGSGSLTATGGRNGAGIGSGYKGSCGNISISGGTLTVTGGENAAGIGSGNQGSCGNITISGGTVLANTGGSGAGIGSGWGGQCGNITITTGVARVTAYRGPSSPYSIGKGSDISESPTSCGTITIGGTVRSQEDFTGESFTYQP